MGSEQSKPVAVIELNQGEIPMYKIQTLRKMLDSGPVKDNEKVNVICISGVYRSGKSFLLNLLKTYLDHLCKHGDGRGWAASSETLIRGGNWAQGQASVTQGIWMYMYPKLVNGEGIIFMDCQGTTDLMRSTPRLDAQILFLALQLSDVHILNVDSRLRADDLDRLSLCLYFADDESGEKLFKHQIILIRNWGNNEEPNQIDSVIQSSAHEVMKKTARGIKNAFEKVEIMALPTPGQAVVGACESNSLRLGNLTPNFLEKAQALFQCLITECSSRKGNSKTEFLDLFKHASNRAVGRISTPQEAFEESLIKNCYMKSMKNGKWKLEQLESGIGRMTAEVVEERVTGIFDEVRDHFQKQGRVKKCENRGVISDYMERIEKEESRDKSVLVSKCKEAALRGKIEAMELKQKRTVSELEETKVNLAEVRREGERMLQLMEEEKLKAAARERQMNEATEREIQAMNTKHDEEMKKLIEAVESSNDSNDELERKVSELREKHTDTIQSLLMNKNSELEEMKIMDKKRQQLLEESLKQNATVVTKLAESEEKMRRDQQKKITALEGKVEQLEKKKCRLS